MKAHITLTLRCPGGEGQREGGTIPWEGQSTGSLGRPGRLWFRPRSHVSLSGTGFPKLP